MKFRLYVRNVWLWYCLRLTCSIDDNYIRFVCIFIPAYHVSAVTLDQGCSPATLCAMVAFRRWQTAIPRAIFRMHIWISSPWKSSAVWYNQNIFIWINADPIHWGITQNMTKTSSVLVNVDIDMAEINIGQIELTHLPLVLHICVSKLGKHWFRQWVAACSAPSHYLKQCRLLVNWTLGNKRQ